MKKTAAKLLALLLVSAMMLPALAGCKKPGGEESGSVNESTASGQESNSGTESKGGEEETSQATDPGEESAQSGNTESGSGEESGTAMEMPEVCLPSGIVYNVDHQYFYGVGYVEDQMNNRVTVEQAVYLIKSLGCRSVRVWASCITSSHAMDSWRVERLHDLVGKLKSAGIQVIFTFYSFESPEKGGLTTFIPRRNLTAGSNYMKALQNWEDMTYMVIKEFPEVDYWELGNEWNHTGALNPTDYNLDGTGGDAFTLKEKADISTDLIQLTMKSARRAGSKATMLLPAMAPSDGMDGISMTDYLEFIYQNIESGDWGSTKRSDFFDALAWHPYCWSSAVDLNWVSNNNRVYMVAVNHGDAGIPVYLTEMGYSDGGNERADLQQAEWMVAAYDMIKKYMPYVESLHYYRMFTDTSRGEDRYGLINQPEDGFGPKHKGEAYQKMTGGTGDLWKFYMPLDEEDE